MLKHADPILKISLALAALFVGAGTGYYYGIFLPAQDIRQQAQVMEERKAEAKAASDAIAERARLETAAQNEYELCLGQTEQSYRDRWSRTCEGMHNADMAAFADCADDFFSTEQGCLAKHPIRPALNCTLPTDAAHAIAEAREKQKAQCLSRLKARQQGAATESMAAPHIAPKISSEFSNEFSDGTLAN